MQLTNRRLMFIIKGDSMLLGELGLLMKPPDYVKKQARSVPNKRRGFVLLHYLEGCVDSNPPTTNDPLERKTFDYSEWSSWECILLDNANTQKKFRGRKLLVSD